MYVEFNMTHPGLWHIYMYFGWTVISYEGGQWPCDYEHFKVNK